MTATTTASISAFGKARSTVGGTPLSADELRKIDAFWRASNYLALGMTYLKANPLLKEPLKPEHIKVFEFKPTLSPEEVSKGVAHIKNLWGAE